MVMMMMIVMVMTVIVTTVKRGLVLGTVLWVGGPNLTVTTGTVLWVGGPNLTVTTSTVLIFLYSSRITELEMGMVT